MSIAMASQWLPGAPKMEALGLLVQPVSPSMHCSFSLSFWEDLPWETEVLAILCSPIAVGRRV